MAAVVYPMAVSRTDLTPLNFLSPMFLPQAIIFTIPDVFQWRWQPSYLSRPANHDACCGILYLEEHVATFRQEFTQQDTLPFDYKVLQSRWRTWYYLRSGNRDVGPVSRKGSCLSWANVMRPWNGVCILVHQHNNNNNIFGMGKQIFIWSISFHKHVVWKCLGYDNPYRQDWPIWCGRADLLVSHLRASSSPNSWTELMKGWHSFVVSGLLIFHP